MKADPQRVTIVAPVATETKPSADLVLTREGHMESVQFLLPEGVGTNGSLWVVQGITADGKQVKITVFDPTAVKDGRSDYDTWTGETTTVEPETVIEFPQD